MLKKTITILAAIVLASAANAASGQDTQACGVSAKSAEPDSLRKVPEQPSPEHEPQTLTVEDSSPTADNLLAELPGSVHVFNAAQLRDILDDFNAEQDRSFNVEEGRSALPEGHTQLDLTELGKYFVIQRTRVDSSHTDGIDVGSDSFQSIYFTKWPLRELVRLEGPTYSFFNPMLQLAIPASTTCLGLEPQGTVKVYNIETKELHFKGTLPEHTISFSVDSAPKGNVMHIDTLSEEQLPLDEREKAETDETKHCEVGYWVKKIETSLELSCHPQTKQCSMKTLKRNVFEGCSEIGGCD